MRKMLFVFLFAILAIQAQAQTKEATVNLTWSTNQTTGAFIVKLTGLSQVISVADNSKCKFDYVMGEDVSFVVSLGNSSNKLIDPVRLIVKNTEGKRVTCVIYVYLVSSEGSGGTFLQVN